VVRGLAAGSVATALALFFHVAAGAPMPGWLGVVVPLVASIFVAVLVSRQRFSWGRLSVSAGVAQYFFHSLFVLGAMPFDLGGLGHAHHDHGVMGMATHEASHHGLHAGHGGPWMLLAHVAAAVLTTVLVQQGEAIFNRLATWGALALRRLFARIPQMPVGDAGCLRWSLTRVQLLVPSGRVPGGRSTRAPPTSSSYLLAA